jgi:hypothetical protein
MSDTKKRIREKRIRELKVRLIAMDWFEAGSVKSLKEARRILDSLDDSSIDFEYDGLPRMILVRPVLDRYETQITKEMKR